MGLWGPLVFTIPLLAAWYSYEHLGQIRRTYDQTIRALGAAPELGGVVRVGHSERVAATAVSVATELGFSRHELAQLETAALLHHLGQVCLDEPEDGRAPEPAAVASSGAEILRSTPLLAPAGDIIASETMPLREKNGSRPSVLSGQVLKVASAFDELVRGPPRAGAARARSALLRAGVPLRRACARCARDRARPRRPARARRLSVRSGGLRGFGAGTRPASEATGFEATSITDRSTSPIENCWLGTPGAENTSPRNGEEVVVLLGPVLHRSLDRRADLAAVAFDDVVLRGHPLVQCDHEHVERDADA